VKAEQKKADAKRKAEAESAPEAKAESAPEAEAPAPVVAIANTTLGRYRAEIDAVKSVDAETLKAMGFATVEEAVESTLKSIAIRAKISIDGLQAQLASLSKPSRTGKREADKNTRDSLIGKTQSFLGCGNLAIAEFRGDVKLSDAEKIRAFNATGEIGDALSTALLEGFAPVGAMSMFWNPRAQIPEAADGLSVYIGGWDDNSPNPRYQYAPRKCPISKRSGYRDDSFEPQMLDVMQSAPAPDSEAES